MCLSQEESWKEELKEKCGTKVSAYKQVHSERAGLGVQLATRALDKHLKPDYVDQVGYTDTDGRSRQSQKQYVEAAKRWV